MSMPPAVRVIESRHNPFFKGLAKLLGDAAAMRRQRQAWLEGEHLCTAYLARGFHPAQALVGERAWGEAGRWKALACRAAEVVVLPDALMKALSGLESPPAIAYLVDLGAAPAITPGVRTVVLDRLQDPGNAGSILRTAAAMGFAQVVALPGTVSLWSPKVLRAGMGAHFALRLVEGVDEPALEALQLPLVSTQLHDASPLYQAALPDPLAWVMGHEGQGVSASLSARCALRVNIPQPGGEESLNVAAAAAICLAETARRAG